jgi:hypothetical protein
MARVSAHLPTLARAMPSGDFRRARNSSCNPAPIQLAKFEAITTPSSARWMAAAIPATSPPSISSETIGALNIELARYSELVLQ